MAEAALSGWLREANLPLWEAMQTHRFVRELAGGTLPAPARARYLGFARGFGEVALPVLGQALVKAPGTPQRRRVAVALHGVVEQRLAWLERAPDSAAPPLAGFNDALAEIARVGSYADILVTMLAVEWSAAEWSAALAAGPEAGGPLAEWVALLAGEGFAAHVAWLRLETDREGAMLDGRGRTRASALFARALQLAIGFHEAACAEPAA